MPSIELMCVSLSHSFSHADLPLLGVIRWCLLSAVTSALDFCSTPRGDKERESAREMAREREMQQHGRGSSDLPDTWQLSLYTSEDMINERDRTDPYLSATCAIINRVVLSEVQKKDLEMIANVVLYTLSCKSRTVSTAKKSESRSKTDSTTQSSGRSHGLGAGVGTGVGDDDESGDTARVGPLTMLRMYLLRLLFTAYDSHITGITIRSSAFKADLKDKDKQYQVMLCLVLGCVVLCCVASFMLFVCLCNPFLDPLYECFFRILQAEIELNEVLHNTVGTC